MADVSPEPADGLPADALTDALIGALTDAQKEAYVDARYEGELPSDACRRLGIRPRLVIEAELHDAEFAVALAQAEHFLDLDCLARLTRIGRGEEDGAGRVQALQTRLRVRETRRTAVVAENARERELRMKEQAWSERPSNPELVDAVLAQFHDLKAAYDRAEANDEAARLTRVREYAEFLKSRVAVLHSDWPEELKKRVAHEHEKVTAVLREAEDDSSQNPPTGAELLSESVAPHTSDGLVSRGHAEERGGGGRKSVRSRPRRSGGARKTGERLRQSPQPFGESENVTTANGAAASERGSPTSVP